MSMTSIHLLWLALAGAAGTLMRFALSSAVQTTLGHRFPGGTLMVNLLGCFLFGIVWCLAEQRSWVRPEVSLFVLTGFLGAFTTFATFGHDTVQLLQDRAVGHAVANLLANNAGGIIAIFAGMAAARWL